VKLRDQELGNILPPPGDTLRARRPSIWELPEDMMMGTFILFGIHNHVRISFICEGVAEAPQMFLEVPLFCKNTTNI
jgi:hypothetical protein